ncbi:MAG: methyltransferase domain-containing protein [Rhodobacteraceae bacterium]|nr:methyltransferase domain-containing protein [Paracoccaceae bacterium]
MADVAERVAEHYTLGTLDGAIRQGLEKLGVTGDPTLDQLAAVDEFHMGGRAATAELAGALGLAAGHRLLDIGCGLGGTARYLAATFGVTVDGVDLTPEFIAVGTALTARLGLADRVRLTEGNALRLPFAAGSFDAATLLHVGMNIADKAALFAGIAQVLRPGGVLAVYDVMRTGDAPLAYPVAWAADAGTSFLASPADYRAALQRAGFETTPEIDRRDMALAGFKAMKTRLAEQGPPPLGLHLLMGAQAPAKVANMVANLESGTIAPVQIVARRR